MSLYERISKDLAHIESDARDKNDDPTSAIRILNVFSREAQPPMI
jgi:hypothetical protein